jgi:hypothetical protein
MTHAGFKVFVAGKAHGYRAKASFLVTLMLFYMRAEPFATQNHLFANIPTPHKPQNVKRNTHGLYQPFFPEKAHEYCAIVTNI